MNSEYIKASATMTVHDFENFSVQYKKKKKRHRTAFLLWMFGSPFGLHRFYTKDYFGGVVIAVLTIFTLGILGFVGLADIFNLHNQVERYNQNLARELSANTRKKYLKGVY